MTAATVPCVHAVGEPTVRAEPEYSLWGMFALSIGITAQPIAVQFRCSTCGRVFARSQDPALRRRHTS